MLNLTTTARQFVTIAEFAEATGHPKRTVYYWAEKGRMETVRTPKGRRITIAEARRVAALLDVPADPDTPESTVSVQPGARSA
jgi:excisionase family DNA binding protein